MASRSASTCYKILTEREYRAFMAAGSFPGAPVDLRDGFIHLSFSHQVRETAAKHFADKDDLHLVALDAAALGPDLRLEPSRGGDLFPHLYAPLPATAVTGVTKLPLIDGVHRFPADIP